MPKATVDGITLAYELIGEEGRPWVITPGGRYTKDSEGVRELAVELAAGGNRVLIWDRPNCGESDVCFTGDTESTMQADALAGLLTELDMAPAVIIGGSGGARVSMLAAARHPEVASGLGIWWISGGVFGLMSLGNFYCGPSIKAAWNDGMEAVAELPTWSEVITKNPGNRQRFLDQDRAQFIATFERWMHAYCARDEELVPGMSNDDARKLDVPTLVFRSGESDAHHTRATSERVAQTLPNAKLVEPPWGDREWIERSIRFAAGGGVFPRWPLLAPPLLDWARDSLG